MLVSMRRALGFTVMLIIMLQTLHLIPITSSDNNEVDWTEHINIEGNCRMDNVRKHFQINKTVVEIIVILHWVTDDGWANLDISIEGSDGYVVNASFSTEMPEVMRVREFPNRGRWTFVVVPTSCGTTGGANFTANITLHNIVLPEFEVSDLETDAGNNITMSLSSSYENISHYYFDYGDDTNSGWINHSSISKIYNSSGQYYPKAKVQYYDGTESDWAEAGLIEVKGDEEPDLILVTLVSLVILILITVLAFFTFKKRKGV
jgi:hypothetical protein